MEGRLSLNPVVSEELICAFCRGRGRDPFNIMSSLFRKEKGFHE